MPSPPTATTTGASVPSLWRTPVGGYILALLVLLASLLVVALYWQTARQREMQAAEAEFHADTDEITALLKQRLGS
jgi:Flp pilus assembly protein TadB